MTGGRLVFTARGVLVRFGDVDWVAVLRDLASRIP
jgi:hypothetical protein